MNRFEKKAQEIVRKIWADDQIKRAEVIANALKQEYKNGRDKRLGKNKITK